MATKEASPIIAGYIFQVERALYRLFSSEVATTAVGIETDDDVVEISKDETGNCLSNLNKTSILFKKQGTPIRIVVRTCGIPCTYGLKQCREFEKSMPTSLIA